MILVLRVCKILLSRVVCMAATVSLIWPLPEPVPLEEEATEIYAKLAPLHEESSLWQWMDRCIGRKTELALRAGLKPFTVVHPYYEIDERGEYKDGPDDWFSPEELEAATKGFMSKMGLNDLDALFLCECWVREIRTRSGNHDGIEPMPEMLPGEDPFLVGLWRTEALGLLISNLESIVQAARNCKREGIERLAFGWFG